MPGYALRGTTRHTERSMITNLLRCEGLKNTAVTSRRQNRAKTKVEQDGVPYVHGHIRVFLPARMTNLLGATT